MYLTDEILDKLNAGSSKGNGLKKASPDEKVTLPDIMVRSFAEVKELAGDALTWGEKNFLYQQAQKELKENKMAESRILSRANPQLANAVRLGIRQSSMLRSYDDLFPQRAGSFVKPGSVASMFSPAGYLTELYREARSLHADASQYHLDTRRPDLASLSLSQTNMDDELSTLSLSNELLLNNIEASEKLDYDGVMEMLATYRLTGITPYNQPYEALRQSIIVQDPEFAVFRNNPAVAAQMDTASLLGIQADISPELRRILTEEITKDNADELLKKNFGDIDVTIFQSVAYLARWYGLTYDEMSSLLGLVTASAGITPGVQYYQNDQLISLVESDGELAAVLMTRTPGGNYDQFGYIELIPVSGDNYQLRFTVKSGNAGNGKSVNIGTSGAESSDLLKDGVIPGLNAPATFSIAIDSAKLTQGVTIGVTRYSGSSTSSYQYATTTFQKTDYSFSAFLLKLNKLIRLYKVTGIAPSDIRSIIESSNSNLEITSDVLSQLFRVNYYMQRYGIDASAALVLAGAAIGQVTRGNQVSAFTRLFNTPMLNGTEFSADGTTIKLTPADVTDTFRTGVIKRAFGVSDTELYTLWTLAQGSSAPGDFAFTIENLSALYRVSLLASVHDLSITELAALLSVSPYASTPAGEALATLVSFTDRYTQWLKDQNWTVSNLYLMLTGRFSTTLSPDIENLITTLKNGLASQDLSSAGEAALITAAAPFVAAATQLDSAETAAAVLQWLGQLKPQGLTVAAFLTLADKDGRTDAETSSLVSYCQVMGQLALIVRNTGLNAVELSWVVAHPTIITEKATVLNHDTSTLYDLTQLHALLSRCGTRATEILTSLSGKAGSEKNNLAIKTVATALSLDEQALTQALAQCSSYAYFYSWIHLRDALQWLDVAGTFGITPASVATLVKLTPASPYADWVAASHALQAGLNTQQTARLSTTLDEALSAAASAYAIKNIAPSWVTDRDKLYSWLLIDNQVSAQIKTTRIAEAIASVQLYVNRALSGQESNLVSTVKSNQFFNNDWDRYNKRYSTWAGVSELVYYPENYIDPTLRIGQTSMMDSLLQRLSQNKIDEDIVSDGVMSYLTSFDSIANLQVINGYHDNFTMTEGHTYFLGNSQADYQKFYWRSVDHSKFIEGKFSANAWSEWTEIKCGTSAFNDFIRLAIYDGRLHVFWLEQIKTKSEDGKKTLYSYQLKISHLRYDGSWNSPVSITVTDLVTSDNSTVAPTMDGFYCAAYNYDGAYLIGFYKKNNSYSEDFSDINALWVFRDYSSQVLDSDRLKGVTKSIYSQLEKPGEKVINVLFDNDFGIMVENGNISQNSHFNTQISLTDISIYEASAGDITVSATPQIKVNRCVHYNDVTKLIVESFGKAGNTVYSYGECQIVDDTWWHSNYAWIVLIVTQDNVTLYLHAEADKSAPYCCYKNAEFKNPTTYENFSNGRLFAFTLPINEVDIDKVLDFDSVTLYGNESHSIMGVVGLSSKEVSYYFDPKNISVDIEGVNITAAESCPTLPSQTSVQLEYNFSSVQISLKDKFHDGVDSYVMTCSFMIKDSVLGELYSGKLNVTFSRKEIDSENVMTLHETDNGSEYLQYKTYRTRLNTLFAKSLIGKASLGVDAVLSMSTQNIQEPKLGKGTYITLDLAKYDENIHGSSKKFEITMCDVFADGDHFILASGTLNDVQQTTCTFFLPRLDESKASPTNMYFCANYQSGYTSKIQIVPSDSDCGWKIGSPATFSGLDNIYGTDRKTEPMDFSGANALYFWELFYYTPMMVFKRLLSESNFIEATRWLHYVWNPAGYLVDGEMQDYYWNVRPLKEEATWHANPLDSVDPDAVAQSDPLHYKVATFMSYLDLLIARGDAAYRQLERDTLNEAKMWYVQALDILGDEPYPSQSTGWTSPLLSDAATGTTKKSVQQALLDVRQQVASGELRTANSLTDLFLPQQNEKLAGYWQTLAQRLYNLRHNLSIDGSPLTLSVYATPADPAALLSAAVNASLGGRDLPAAVMPAYRFPVMLESARSMVGQLTQFGSTLLSITERQDAEALSELLQTQGAELVLQSIALQNSSISEIDADKVVLEESLSGAQSRLDSYTALYDEDVNTGETQAMNLFLSSSSLANGGQAFHTAAGALDLVPNIFGLADGGSRWGAAFTALAGIADLSASATHTAADRLSQSEIYRRRRQEWEIQRNAAQSEVNQINAQLDALAVRREGAVLQKAYLETQQAQTQAQMTFLQNKFTSKALYNWLRGKLAAIYYQFYDLTVSRCLMAQKAYQWALANETSFIRPGAWQGTYAGLMAGETLMLNLAQMEQDYLQKDQREKEVVRTVCLSEVYAGLTDKDSKGNSLSFNLSDQVVALVTAGSGSSGTDANGLSVTSDKQLQATLKLSDLNIGDDYPSSLGKTRRIKQISVTLPALVGPYQDVRAVLSYGDPTGLAKGCDALAVSHGMNDSGQFQLDFNDGRWLPFEGVPVDSSGVLTLGFPGADGKQKDLLLSLTDIILHIRYTIAS